MHAACNNIFMYELLTKKKKNYDTDSKKKKKELRR